MVYLVVGFLVSVGFGLGKVLIDVLSEVVFSRLHKSNRYRVICKKDAVNDGMAKGKKRFPIGFRSDGVRD